EDTSAAEGRGEGLGVGIALRDPSDGGPVFSGDDRLRAKRAATAPQFIQCAGAVIRPNIAAIWIGDGQFAIAQISRALGPATITPHADSPASCRRSKLGRRCADHRPAPEWMPACAQGGEAAKRIPRA